MNGLFLTCLLVSASAAGGQWTFPERIEMLTQRIATAGLDVGKAFTGPNPFGAAKRQLTGPVQGTLSVASCPQDQLPVSPFVPSIPVLRAIGHTAPIRGPAL